VPDCVSAGRDPAVTLLHAMTRRSGSPSGDERANAFLSCRIGPVQFPFGACAERFVTRDLLARYVQAHEGACNEVALWP
jgi:hypothetical protein